MKKLFHINIHVKKTKIYTLFNLNSYGNIIVADLVRKFGLEIHNHPRSYPLGWVNKYGNIKVMK